MVDPLKYYDNNLCGTKTMVQSLVEHGIDKIVFSSTAATYGEPEKVPIVETDRTEPTNTYGETKLSMEKMFKWVGRAHGLRYVSLRYFNACGAHVSGQIGEDHNPETHLIPLILQVPNGKREAISSFGTDYDTKDGTWVRAVSYTHLDGRGDAYCGMLNASYNLKLRNIKAYIPEYPVGTAEECADMIHEFLPIARTVKALSELKIISFGPRPLNFLACNAPIKPLYDLGIEIEENSELDLFEAFNQHEGDERIPAIIKEMEEELGAGNKKPEILSKLAQYELTLKDWIRDHKGYRKYVTIAGKCWPAFQTQFGFVPCYVNSRLAAQDVYKRQSQMRSRKMIL